MMPYILHVSVIVIVCFSFYKLLLQKETFYRLNRWTLLACLTAAFTLPLLPAPYGWNAVDRLVAETRETKASTDKTESRALKTDAGVGESKSGVIDIRSTGNEIVSGGNEATPVVETTPVVAASPVAGRTNSAPGHEAGGEQVTGDRKLTGDGKGTGDRQGTNQQGTGDGQGTGDRQAVNRQVTNRQASGNEASDAIGVLMILHALFYCYLIGVCFFGARLMLQMVVLCYQAYTQPVIRDGRYRIVETSGNRAPCSFGNNIFINPALYDPETYQQILIHEKIHVSGRHTLDILAAEIAVVLQWFNPFIWLYRREVENNLEFLTDQSVLLHRDVERSAYQLSLLRVSAPHLPFSITNNYNQSLLKRRIVMMNSQRSPRSTVWKYFFLLPLLTALVITLNKPAALSQPRQPRPAIAGTFVYSDTTIRPASRSTGTQPSRPTPVPDTVPVRSTPTESWSLPDAQPVISIQPEVSLDLQPQVSLQLQPAISLELQPALNLQLQPAISLQPLVSLQNEVSLQPAISVQPVISLQTEETMNVDVAPDVHVDLDLHTTSDSTWWEGSWFVSSRGDNLEFELRAGDDEHSWGSSLTVKKSEIDPFPGQGSITFKVVREAGTMTFKGQFDGQQGFGHFQFQPDPAYFQALKQMGVEDVDNNNEEGFFLRNVKKDFVAMLQRNGYMPMSRHNVVSLSAMNIDEDFIKSMKGAGIEGLDDVHSFVTLKAMHIDKAYIDDLHAAGYDHLSTHDLVSLKAQHIDGQYVRSMAAGKSDSFIPPHELIAYKASGIDSAYLASLRKLGYASADRHDIFSLHSMHITADFIKGFQDAGLTNLPMRTLVAFKANGITPEYAKAFHDLGYDDIETTRLVSLKSMGITPYFVQQFHKIGYDHIPYNLLASLKAMGIDAAYVSKMKGKGFDSQDLRKYMRLKQDFN
jgi:BlaR1 peptidase M56